MPASHPHYASTSLYVGDLPPEATETILFEIFNAIGPVASIRVCRECGSRKSLGYAYVNYHSIQDAERALDTLNFTNIKGVPCRIMWSHRDPSLRKSGTGNIFVKNLDKSLDNKALYDTFSLFGNILSCKVATDEFGKSRGYGFVHYETEESAKNAVEKVNGMLIGQKNVFAAPHRKRSERLTSKSENFTNLYVKHFPDSWTDETLQKVFKPFGEITSSAIVADAQGRRFGFVNYESREAARDAVAELHGKKPSDDGIAADQTPAPEETPAITDETSSTKEEGKDGAESTSRLYVQRAMTKTERVVALKEQFTATTQGKPEVQMGVNLYVKNLDDQVTDEILNETFSKFGSITSAKVMRDEAGVSKGFGFVCFTFPESATKAVTAMHLKIFMGKPLYVGLAERREQRVERLQQRFRFASRPLVPTPIQSYSAQMYFGAPPLQQRPVGPNFATPGGSTPWRQPMQRPYGPPQMPMYPYGVAAVNAPPAASGYVRSVRPRQGSAGTQPTFKFTPQARNREFPHAPPVTQQPPMMPHSFGETLSAQTLAAAHPQMQKQMLGEKLYPLVAKHQPDLAGKITGMMLEMDNGELLSLIESEAQLHAKVDEAMNVLHRHQSVPTAHPPALGHPQAISPAV